jgi:hypothetical protein
MVFASTINNNSATTTTATSNNNIIIIVNSSNDISIITSAMNVACDEMPKSAAIPQRILSIWRDSLSMPGMATESRQKSRHFGGIGTELLILA